MMHWRKTNPVLLAVIGGVIGAGATITAAQQPDDANDLTQIRNLVNEKHFPAAEQGLRAYVKLHPESASGHFLLGYVLFSEQKATESLAEYTAGARFQNPGAEDLMAVAADYILLHDNEDADKWLTRVTEMEPLNALAWYYLGRTRYYESRYDDAVKAFQTCLRLSPHDVKAQTNLGLTYQEMGRRDDAIAAYREAIAWDRGAGDKDAQPYLDLGSLLYRMQKIEDGIPYLQRAVAIEPNNPKVHEELGRAFEALHREADAEAEFRRAVALAPDSSALHYTLGRILKSQGKDADAEKEFATTARLNGTKSSKDVPNFDLHQ